MDRSLVDQLPRFARWRITPRERAILELALMRIKDEGKLEMLRQEHAEARSRLMDDLRQSAVLDHGISGQYPGGQNV